ncbi:MAG TPA: response regulator transcription factor [Polyangiaceae bacterium]|jgi:DNA-binding response OmpR family regulator|nr:response regulator transcription factor [Polyangiaceae bacterium]
MRILIVEDSDAIRRMIEALLRARGHEVVAVSTGTKGVDAALAGGQDAIVLDLHLPGSFDGFEVCRRVREAEATRNVPIIVISALTDDTAKRRAMEAGASAYYTKPFSPTALLKEMESLPARMSAKLPAKS